MVLVIEGGRADGTDFVMGEHHHNGLSRAKAAGQQIVQVQVTPIGGDDHLSTEVRLVAAVDQEKGEVAVLVTGLAGRKSLISGFQGVPIMFGELMRVPISNIKGAVAAALDGPKEDSPVEAA